MPNQNKIGPIRTWALAAGGMVGGGIYIALAVVIEAAGQWAWLSFTIAGIAAILSAHSYAALTIKYSRSGGVFSFLEQIDHKAWAGRLSWLLILGYMLTISVYAFAFGNYVSHALGGSEILIRVLIVLIIAFLIGLNLLGAGKITSVETIIVSSNLFILLVLAIAGITDWKLSQLSTGIENKPVFDSIFGAAAIFVAYEGFQLLTYDYDELNNPKQWFHTTLVSAAIFVVLCYVLVTLGATMITGADGILAHRGVSLSYAAQQKFGLPGLVFMSIAAAFATSAAINSTLFSTAKLAKRVSRDHELPKWFAHTNTHGIPDRAVIVIATTAGALAMFGSLSTLVEAASLVFVTTFVIVNGLAFVKLDQYRWVSAGSALLSVMIGMFLVIRLSTRHPVYFGVLLIAIGTIFLVRYNMCSNKH